MTALDPEFAKIFKAPLKFYKGGAPVTSDELAALEQKLKLTLPGLLKSFLLQHGSGMLSPQYTF